MTALPEPPAAPAAGQAHRDAVINERANQMMTAISQLGAQQPTSYNNPDLPSWEDGPRIGDAPPVKQYDKRIVPAWAAGIAVASIGVGAGVTGIGCGAWLVLNALASVTLNGVLMVTLPFAGLAMAATAIGAAISRARSAVTTNVFNGSVDQRNVHSTTNGVWAKTNNKQ
ncbi:hypothetical protein [Streptomyces sp. ok210]|uniref:hypothetical protein n=1 Tax=Streptomyces sp. ok210 TaxID=1761905 RepID=UPI0008E96D1E|nr:hypothetical protein [Streptomyces sp. ok210]SFT31833.1 hypothetical protein SAMN04487982_12449 [Streptomyces sp. ok210]